MTKNQKLYNAELKKIRARQRKLMSQGYILQEIELPKRPKRVTQKSILRLKKFNLAFIRTMAEKEINGEYLPGPEAFKIERQLKRKAKYISTSPAGSNISKQSISNKHDEMAYTIDQEADKILSTFEFELQSFGGNLSGSFLKWYYQLLEEYGPTKLAQALQNMPNSFYDYFEANRPDYGKAIELFEEELRQYLPGSDKAYDNLKGISEETGYNEWEKSDIDY